VSSRTLLVEQQITNYCPSLILAELPVFVLLSALPCVPCFNMRVRSSALAAALSFGSTIAANVPTSQQCFASNKACYTLNIPQATVDSGSGDIFFQISAPTSVGWAALGQGGGMKGANIFVIYPSANGTSITLSPRLASGEQQPLYNENAKVELLAGSGVANGMMIANVKCSNCDSWNGGSMDFKASSNSWIWGVGSGSSVNSDLQDATIRQHSPQGSDSFSWDMSSAKGGSSVNPFFVDSTSSSGNTATNTTSPSSTSTGAGGVVSCTPNANATDGGPPWAHGGRSKRDACPVGTSPVGSSSTNNDADLDAFDPDTFNRIAVIHGVLAGIAFVGLFPVGAILIRLGNFSNLVWVHAGMQILAYIIYAIAFAMGIWLTRTLQPDNHSHPLIGSLIFIVLLSQPITGWLHHRFFVRFGGRSKSSWFHLIIGRVCVILGMLNGGLGLHLAQVKGGAPIAYAVIVVIMVILYVASIVIGERRRKRAINGQAPAFDQDNSLRLHSFDAAGASRTTLEGTETHVPKYN